MIKKNSSVASECLRLKFYWTKKPYSVKLFKFWRKIPDNLLIIVGCYVIDFCNWISKSTLRAQKDLKNPIFASDHHLTLVRIYCAFAEEFELEHRRFRRFINSKYN